MPQKIVENGNIGVIVGVELKRKLIHFAKLNGMTLSDLVKKVLKIYVDYAEEATK